MVHTRGADAGGVKETSVTKNEAWAASDAPVIVNITASQQAAIRVTVAVIVTVYVEALIVKSVVIRSSLVRIVLIEQEAGRSMAS